MTVAVALHVGAIAPLNELLRDIMNLTMAGVKFDLFVNLVRGKVDTTAAVAAVQRFFPQAIIIESENRGMDIGGFFYLLPLILRGSYQYILKLHTKSMYSWRRALVAPLCGTSGQVRHCLKMFEINQRLGMLGASNHLYREHQMRKPNYYYVQQLTKKFGIPYSSCSFIGGTMFIVRTSAIEKYFRNADLPTLISELNTPQTLDPYWYMVNYRDPNVKSVEDAVKHYEEYGEKAGRFRNCLDARERGATRYVPDAMKEHSFERVFGLLIQSAGYTILGV